MIAALRLGTVLVEGPSMLPALRSGDVLLVRHRATVRPGDLVVGRPLVEPGWLVVKRAVEPVPGAGPATWLVSADNAQVRGQGWTDGHVDVEARVLLRLWPRPSLRP